jgi:hypothetical protein
VKPYLAWSDARIEGDDWQGIRYLSLVLDPVEDVPRGASLTVHLARPADGLAEEHIQLSGGRRLHALPHEVIFPNDENGNRLARFEIRFPVIGDPATYMVTLLGGGAHRLHPFFAMADFTFAVDCEAGDCRPLSDQVPRSRAPAPAVDLLTKDYAGFLSLLADRVRVTNPHWADLSPASFERVLLELLAHHGDMLSYYQDRVANEAFLDTATQRYSIRQHGLLLGYQLFDGASATTVLGVECAVSGHVPRGLQVRMEERPGEAPVVFSVRERTRVEQENNALVPAAWPGAHDARVPAGETRMLLWGAAQALRQGQRIAFVQGAFSQIVTLTEVTRMELPGWVEDPSEPLTPAAVPVTEITWSAAERLARDLFPWQHDPPITDAAEQEAQRLRIYGNLVDAVHGENRVAWLNPGSGVRRHDVVMTLDSQNSTVLTVRRGPDRVRMLRALRVPEGPVLFDRAEDGSGALALELLIDDELWYAQEHLHRSHSYDHHYVATTAEDGSVWLQLGDGIHGRAVELPAAANATGPRIAIRYRIGDPISGNCALGTLTRAVRPEDTGSDAGVDFSGLGATTFTNVVPGRGGRQPEAMDAARQAIPASLRRAPLERAVTLYDYASAAEAVPGVARAAARSLGGMFNTVVVLVDPDGQGELDPALARAVSERLDRLRMTGREHWVAAPAYVPLDIDLGVCAQPGWPRHEVRDRVYTALRPGTRERPGFFHPDHLSFAEAIELGDVLAHVQSLPGVRSVKAFVFRRLLVSSANPVAPRIRLGATEIARMDGDPAFPDNGRLVVRVAGLDSTLSDPEHAYDVEAPPGGNA